MIKKKIKRFLIYWKYKNINVKISKEAILSFKTLLLGSNSIGKYTNVVDSQVDFGTYIGNCCILNKVKLGKFCSLANHIKVLKNNHPLNYFSTHPAFHRKNGLMQELGLSYVNEDKIPEFNYITDDYQVVIGSDVWIGENVLIMSGVQIGDGAVVAAGSIITKDVEAYSIVAGVPAKHLKYRFEQKLIDDIKRIDFWSKSNSEIQKWVYLFDNPIELIEKSNENI